MSEIMTVDYETEVAIESKSTEQLTAEVNVRYRQAESLASMSAAMLADAGRRLIEIKGRMPHGEFGDWCKDNLEFSYRKAARMMQLAERMADEGSLFSKMPTLADIGISRVWELLAAPEEVAAEVVETEDVSEMTVRELKEKIKKLTADKKAAEERADEAILAAASADTQELEDMRLSVEHMKDALDKKEEERAQAVTAQQKAADQLAKSKEKLKALKDQQREIIDKAIEERAEELRKEARAEVEEKIKVYEEDIKDNEEEIERLTKKLQNAENDDFARFRVQANILQNAFNDCLGAIDNTSVTNKDSAEAMKEALRKILKMELETLE